MTSTKLLLKPSGFRSTSRVDAWWLQLLLVFLGFSTFIIYSTWAAFQGDHYSFDHLINSETQSNLQISR